MRKFERINSDLNILAIGAQLSLNQGSAAMAVVAFRIMSTMFPGIHFSLLSPSPSTDIKYCNYYGVRLVKQGSKSLPLHIFSIIKGYLKADVILALNGDSYSDDCKIFGTRVPCSLLVWAQISLGLLLKKPVIIMPQSIGPFKTSITRFLARFSLNRTKIILARGNITSKYLESIGVNKNKIYETCDLAFLLEPCSKERTLQIIADEKANISNHPIVGMSISQSIVSFAKNNRGLSRRIFYYSQMAKLADYLVKEFNATVFLFASVTERRSQHDDRIAIHEVFRRMIFKDQVFEIKGEYDPSEFRGVVGVCDLFIGARMHANIAALSMNIPTIAISYSHKTSEIMRQCGQEKYICDINDITFEDMKSKVNDIWNQKEKVKMEINDKVLKMRANLKTTLNRIKSEVLT
jgi:colanic acid/amylovoran biosynthesis protein